MGQQSIDFFSSEFDKDQFNWKRVSKFLELFSNVIFADVGIVHEFLRQGFHCRILTMVRHYIKEKPQNVSFVYNATMCMKVFCQNESTQEVCHQELTEFLQLVFSNSWCTDIIDNTNPDESTESEEKQLNKNGTDLEWYFRDLLNLLVKYYKHGFD